MWPTHFQLISLNLRLFDLWTRIVVSNDRTCSENVSLGVVESALDGLVEYMPLESISIQVVAAVNVVEVQLPLLTSWVMLLDDSLLINWRLVVLEDKLGFLASFLALDRRGERLLFGRRIHFPSSFLGIDLKFLREHVFRWL